MLYACHIQINQYHTNIITILSLISTTMVQKKYPVREHFFGQHQYTCSMLIAV